MLRLLTRRRDLLRRQTREGAINLKAGLEKVSSRRRRKKSGPGRPRAATSDRLSGSTSISAGAGPRRDLILFGFLVLFPFLIYNANFRTITTDDTLPNRFLPFGLLLDHSFYLDEWMKLRLKEPVGPNGLYFAAKSHDHWMSAYPIITPVLVTPLYVLPAWWLSRQSPSLYPVSASFFILVSTIEKISASLIAALSVALLFLAFRKIASRNVSLVVALIYGLAGNTWAISSQALWRHGLTELSFALLLWALFRVSDLRSAPFWAGLALSAATTNKPLEALLIIPFLFYFGRRGWKNFLLFMTPLVLLGSLVFAYNEYFFARLLGGYPSPTLGGEGGTHFSFLARLGFGLLGLLISPSRGLLVYTPWTAFALWGAVRAWRENSFGWSRPLIVALAAIIMVQACAGDWWGGWCFGPRYLTDLLPFFAWFVVLVWNNIRARRVLRWTFATTVAVALWVQVVGAFYYPGGYWDRLPVSVDYEPERAWDWSDTQVMRSWRAGPARPALLEAWENLLRARSGASHP